MLGGLARRATLLKNLQNQGGPVLAVDSGDLFFDQTTDQADVKKVLTKARLIAQAYKKMGIVAVNVGDRDLSQGLDFLKQEAAQGLPLISANLVDAVQRRPIFPPSVIREVSGVRIVFVGLLRSPLPAASEKSLEGKAVVEDPLDAARKAVAELKGKADLIILLSDLGWDQDIRIAKDIAGIPFILGGHEGRATTGPFQQGETFIVQSYQKGMYAGVLALPLEKPGSFFQDEGRTTRIQEALNGLDRRSRDLQGAKERNPHLDIRPAIEGIKQQKDKLQKELKEAQKTVAQGTRFRWTLEPISSSLAEDAEVRGLIEATGITKD
jgi:2',3'-cyclic-nucleotide 2'-phosphodiesterase (5'-nucleotidase family)